VLGVTFTVANRFPLSCIERSVPHQGSVLQRVRRTSEFGRAADNKKGAGSLRPLFNTLGG